MSELKQLELWDTVGEARDKLSNFFLYCNFQQVEPVSTFYDALFQQKASYYDSLLGQPDPDVSWGDYHRNIEIVRVYEEKRTEGVLWWKREYRCLMLRVTFERYEFSDYWYDYHWYNRDYTRIALRVPIVPPLENNGIVE